MYKLNKIEDLWVQRKPIFKITGATPGVCTCSLPIDVLF